MLQPRSFQLSFKLARLGNSTYEVPPPVFNYLLMLETVMGFL